MNDLTATTSQTALAGFSKQPKLSDKEPQEFVLGLADTIYNQHKDSEESRCREWVTMIKRQRGSANNLSDAIGVLSPDGRVWLDVESSAYRIMNIFEPTIRANTTTMCQANVVEDIQPSNSRFKGAANVAEGIAEDVNTSQWTESVEHLVCERPQLASFVMVRSYFDEKGNNTATFPEFIDTELEGSGEYACPGCGATGEITSDQLTGGAYPCPECGETTEIGEMSESSFVPVPSFTNKPYGCSKSDVISSFEIRLDTKNTAGGQFWNGRYLEHLTLETREDLKNQYEWLTLSAPEMPCYMLRWLNALETGLKTQSFSWDSGKTQDTDLFEVRRIYAKPKKYEKYRSPMDWSIRSDETGEEIWNMKRGESWEEAVSRQSPPKSRKRKPQGICFTVIGKRMCPPVFADFCTEFSMFQFAPDSFSPYGRPFAILLSIQSDVNDLNTIYMTHLEKNSIANVVVDNEMFDFEDFEQDFVPTRQGKMIEGNIKNHFAVVDPPSLGQEPIMYMNFLLNSAQNLSGVQPAAVGQAQPGTPYHAQLLQVNQSQGLLATALKSKAQGKVHWLKNQLKLAQDTWTEEQFKKVRLKYGLEWQDEDIESFLECNLDEDILISYVEGSELPKTLLQREAKLQNFIAQSMQFAQMGVMTPQMMQEMIAKLADYSDVEFDVGNFEGDRRLAESRNERIKLGAEAFVKQGLSIPPPQIDPQTGQSTDPIMQVVMRIIQQGKCTPNPKAENHAFHKDFWADRVRAVATDDDFSDVNEILLACYNTMIQLHEESEMMLAQQQTMQQMALQQPMVDQQQAQAEQQAQMQAEGQSAQLEQQNQAESERQQFEAERQDAQLANDEANRLQADEHKKADLVDAQLQREHDLEMLKNQPKKEK